MIRMIRIGRGYEYMEGEKRMIRIEEFKWTEKK
jgi:hypothetical protein